VPDALALWVVLVLVVLLLDAAAGAAELLVLLLLLLPHPAIARTLSASNGNWNRMRPNFMRPPRLSTLSGAKTPDGGRSFRGPVLDLLNVF
jgi:hypothetical protein